MARSHVLRLAVWGGLVLGLSTAATAQVANLDRTIVGLRVDSGVLQNESDETRTLFQHVITVTEAASMQVWFGRTTLPEGCVLRLTSLTDGARQHHRGESLRQWRFSSAWFNGSTVLVELIADPGTGPTHVTLDAAVSLRRLGDERSICGPTDDRVLSDDPRCCRVFPAGCTGWLIDDYNHTFLTAGHCADEPTYIEVMQFNVPLSTPGGDWQHPGPEDQYAVDLESLQSDLGSIGYDWAYYGCFANSETGLTPFEAQGAFYELADAAPPVDGQPITITGYGTVASPVDPTWNLAQKTHTGPYERLQGTAIAYRTDTSGGNSGSAVLDERTGLAIGIHTNAGCASTGGENWGCGIHNAELQYALANPRGVCIPNIVSFGFPDGRPDALLPGSPEQLVFTVSEGVEVPIPDSVSLVLTIDGNVIDLPGTPLGDDRYSVTVPALECEQSVSFYLRAQGDQGSTATSPVGAPDTQFSIAVGTIMQELVLEEDLESGIPADWSVTGLWHASDGACAPGNACQGGNVAYFGQDGTCTYDTGNTESGSLSTPPIPAESFHGDITLTFCSMLQTEEHFGYDVARVLVNDVELATITDSSTWVEHTLSIGNFAGDTLTLSWEFDTVDDLYNNFVGWHIDGIRLVASTTDCDSAEPCPGDANGDGLVDVDDVLYVLSAWGTDDPNADLDDSGLVDVNDILFLLSTYGQACP